MQQTQTLKNANIDIFKKHKINDVMDYAQKYNKYINNDFLKKQGFSFEDINLILFNFKEEILTNNNRWLIKENNKLKQEIIEHKLTKKESIKHTETKQQVTENKIISETIEKVADNYKLTILYNKKHRAKQTHIIPIKNVKLVWKLIKKLSGKKAAKIRYNQIVPLVINAHKLHNVSLNAFSGGTNRKHYFRLYKFPLRILKIQGLIQTDFRGNVWINNN